MAFFDKTKTGRLKIPKTYQRPHWSISDASGFNKTIFGEPVPVVGDLVWCGPGGVSAGTVGRIKEISLLSCANAQPTDYHVGVMFIGLDGKEHHGWLAECIKLDENALTEIKDFYASVGRSDRVKDI